MHATSTPRECPVSSVVFICFHFPTIFPHPRCIEKIDGDVLVIPRHVWALQLSGCLITVIRLSPPEGETLRTLASDEVRDSKLLPIVHQAVHLGAGTSMCKCNLHFEGSAGLPGLGNKAGL